MRDTLENNRMFDPFIAEGLRYGTMVQTISADFTLPNPGPGPVIWALNGGASARNIILPPITGATIAMEGRYYRISNISSGASTFTVKAAAADGGATIGTAAQNTSLEVYVANGAWRV